MIACAIPNDDQRGLAVARDAHTVISDTDEGALPAFGTDSLSPLSRWSGASGADAAARLAADAPHGPRLPTEDDSMNGHPWSMIASTSPITRFTAVARKQ